MVSRTVFRPPSAGARGLLDWAVDLWPYVNGKALLSGIKLAELNAADMLDVLHVFFEEDLMVGSKEEAEAKTKGRQVIYKSIYNRTYKYGVTDSGQSYNYSTASDGFVGEEEDKIDDPVKPPTKPFTPATDFNPDSALPFGNNLDAPIG